MTEFVNYDLKRDWMPSYCLRRSKKAKYVHFKMNPIKGLEIVIPHRFALKHLPEVIDKHRLWIEQQESRRIQHITPSELMTKPTKLDFHALGKSYDLAYASSSKNKIIENAHRLTILHQSDLLSNIHLQLKQWIKAQAKIHLTDLFQALAIEHQFTYQKLTIREQKNRWGSCSSKGHIHLNYKLLFLPPNICRHIMLHELCHLIHLNHSKQFWDLLAGYDPFWQKHNKITKKESFNIPLWLL